MCISLSCLNHHVKIKIKANKYFCDRTGAQLWFLQHEAARSISLSCLNHHVKIKIKANKYFCDRTGNQLWFLQHEAARSIAASTSAG